MLDFSKKKILVYVVIGAIIASVSYIVMVKSINNNTGGSGSINANNNNNNSPGTVANSNIDHVQRFQLQFCGSESEPNSDNYVTEYRLPGKCEMPLGIAVDQNASKVWYVSTKNGTLGSFNIERNKFEKERLIPIWQSRGNPTEFSQVWDVKIDGKGDVWFTDEKQNAIWRFVKSSQTFEIYKVPENSKAFGTTYPVSLDFDKNGNIYFVGIRSPSLWFGDISKLKNGTSDGISRIPIPISGFKGIDPFLISTGSVAVDKPNNVVWISMLAFNTRGEIFRYNIEKKTFDTFDMHKEISSPVGIVVDNFGNVWVTDHGTSLFYKLEPRTGNTTKFSTSKVSPRIFGVGGYNNSNNNNAPQGAYTLPYWIKKSADGSLWFNEHTGNKIARFDPSTMTLVEYWIPTQDKLWGQCPSGSRSSCGIANALQFSLGQQNGNNNEVWFTEWSENKIGKISASHGEHLPISITTTSIPVQGITIKKGESADIRVDINAFSNINVNMVAFNYSILRRIL